MGTNFYLVGHRNDDSSEYHIGKRSAAGLYCYDCGATLCRQGVNAIHSGYATDYERCPKCGKTPVEESLNESTAGLELGFAEPYSQEQRKGVRTCSSFTWAMNTSKLKRKRKIIDEYGRTYTMKQFKEDVLANCPIQFHHSIGTIFS